MIRFRRLLVLFFSFILIVAHGCNNRGENKTGVSEKAPAVDKISAPEPDISIYEASLNGQVDQVASLLAAGTDVNAKDEEARTALMYAAYNGHTEIIKRLLEKGALVNLCDTNGRTALMLASSGPFPEVVRLLLDHNADPDIADKEEHFTALMYASAEGQLEVVKL